MAASAGMAASTGACPIWVKLGFCTTTTTPIRQPSQRVTLPGGRIFWSASYRGRLFGATILAQGITGQTAVGAPPPSVTYFGSAYALVSYDLGDWRLSGRVETFETRNQRTTQAEDGRAFTLSVSWSARSWLRLTSELVDLSSRRAERVSDGDNSGRDDRQFQISGRVFL